MDAAKKQEGGLWAIQIDLDHKTIATVPITQEKTFIGRMAQNQVVLDHASVSRSHALIEKSSKQIFVVDQGSQNGTRINGRVLLREEIKPGDILTIGPFTLKLVEVSSQAMERAKKETPQKK